ncbi:39S ribosomal protein L44, mitochondrial [Teleopsis dalmanni]|uniref:39S ribosomal protein L44, mitochondrial n=1 Tax=Teleopsis dalmanni TaxID=139649 RepID=UPI0018CF459C|nr:39S ribosomal protein L44, mitochondrial [Teleopsis dalmanni]
MNLLRRSLSKSLLITPIKSVGVTEPRSIKRWVAPTLRELRKRAKKIDLQNQPNPRSGFVEWNYRAELYAFTKRLNENIDISLLQTAFTQKSYIHKEANRQRDLGIEETDIQINDNLKLSEHGENIAKAYISTYLQYSLPKVPEEGRNAILKYLTSIETLAYIALHLGMKDLLLDTEYPPTSEALSRSLLAVIGALQESSGSERSFLFVRDFICTHLNQRDLLEIWHIQDAWNLLKDTCKLQNIPNPEPRLIGDCGKNTVLATYNVGIYANKKMIGKGFGEDASTAIEIAAIDSLRNLFSINEHARLFDFELLIEPKQKLN